MNTEIARDLFIDGLRNAHAMEVQARELMERQSERLSDYPQVQMRVRQHLDETNGQIKRLEDCLGACGESASTLKDTAMSALGNLAATGHAAASDEILKNTFANEAFEHYEIAAYKSLLTLCDKAGVSMAAAPLRQSLQEEEKMADWIDGHIEEVTLDFLSNAERDRGS
ncbi:MAG: ferritin-like domain-containing protein [Hyphomicrobiales bacterium]|nr:ferritin-like domain-containing protein [Hyphomicrobiales bacterium]MBV9050768.1 ferritin-like domain-containing protein [Hyphomicrobiales bacterium]MBV9978260.1 ferritin-like domain-containing protein [Hyphomicrobiales bacterium]